MLILSLDLFELSLKFLFAILALSFQLPHPIDRILAVAHAPLKQHLQMFTFSFGLRYYLLELLFPNPKLGLLVFHLVVNLYFVHSHQLCQLLMIFFFRL